MLYRKYFNYVFFFVFLIIKEKDLNIFIFILISGVKSQFFSMWKRIWFTISYGASGCLHMTHGTPAPRLRAMLAAHLTYSLPSLP